MWSVSPLSWPRSTGLAKTGHLGEIGMSPNKGDVPPSESLSPCPICWWVGNMMKMAGRAIPIRRCTKKKKRMLTLAGAKGGKGGSERL